MLNRFRRVGSRSGIAGPIGKKIVKSFRTVRTASRKWYQFPYCPGVTARWPLVQHGTKLPLRNSADQTGHNHDAIVLVFTYLRASDIECWSCIIHFLLPREL